MSESHPHGKNTEPHSMIVGNLIAYDGTLCGIYDEPDISFGTTDFDVGFISDKGTVGLVVIMVNKGFYAECSCFSVIGYLLV